MFYKINVVSLKLVCICSVLHLAHFRNPANLSNYFPNIVTGKLVWFCLLTRILLVNNTYFKSYKILPVGGMDLCRTKGFSVQIDWLIYIFFLTKCYRYIVQRCNIDSFSFSFFFFFVFNFGQFVSIHHSYFRL